MTTPHTAINDILSAVTDEQPKDTLALAFQDLLPGDMLVALRVQDANLNPPIATAGPKGPWYTYPSPITVLTAPSDTFSDGRLCVSVLDSTGLINWTAKPETQYAVIR